MEYLSHFGVGALSFAATDIDDLLLLTALFANARLRRANVVAGQFLGIAVLFVACAIAASVSLLIPPWWTALLGLIPLFMGLRGLVRLARGQDDDDDDDEAEKAKSLSGGLQVFSVAAITVANGGDNVGVYIPLFAKDFHAVPVYALAFFLMTGVWCLLSYSFVRNPWFGRHVERYGEAALPFVLVGIGLYILNWPL